jgi:hypothetical protein
MEPINGCERLLTDARIKRVVSRINTGFLRTLPSRCELGQNASDGPLKAASSSSTPDGATNHKPGISSHFVGTVGRHIGRGGLPSSISDAKGESLSEAFCQRYPPRPGGWSVTLSDGVNAGESGYL